MNKLLVTAIAVVALAIGATAKTYSLPKEDSIASVTIPDGWKVEAEDESLTITSKDETIEITMEILGEDQLEGAIIENVGYLKKHKVNIDEKSEKKTSGEINGLKATFYAKTGKDEDGPCNISEIFVRLSDKKLISMLYWAPGKIEQAQLDDIKTILNSIKKK